MNGASSSLSGHIALVTGGAGGIGRAAAMDLLDMGARVVLADVGTDRLAEVGSELGVATAYVDLADDASITHLVQELDAELDGEAITILVNNAGISRIQPLLESDPTDWDLMYRINQRAPMRLTQLLLPGMIARGFGRVITVSSDSARAGVSGQAAYAATKAALFGFAKSVAREVAHHGVTCNVVCPGPIRTPMLEAARVTDPDVLGRLERWIPLGRIGEPEEVSSLIAWLASPRAGYVTGQVLSVSGGVTMH
jgi:2-hydroxycyclohexanecarboxyl-CoA dehydrogenase